jgi:steroid delta-isomerase-like uncharacterized protein
MLESANRHDAGGIHTYLADAMHAVNPRLGTSAASRMHWAQTALLNGFPDLQYRIERMISSGNSFAIECVMSGTHTGTFAGVPPTNKTIELPAAFCIEIVDGKLTDCRSYFDTASLMEQIGAAPTLAREVAPSRPLTG